MKRVAPWKSLSRLANWKQGASDIRKVISRMLSADKKFLIVNGKRKPIGAAPIPRTSSKRKAGEIAGAVDVAEDGASPEKKFILSMPGAPLAP